MFLSKKEGLSHVQVVQIADSATYATSLLLVVLVAPGLLVAVPDLPVAALDLPVVTADLPLVVATTVVDLVRVIAILGREG